MTNVSPNHPSVRSKKGNPVLPITIIPTDETQQAARQIIDQWNTTKDNGMFEAALSETFAEAKALLIKKHLDYGPRNIADAPGGALNGLRVRMHDKTARINHLIDNAADPENESLRDSYLDLLNYAAIGLMVLDGNWPSD